MKTIIMLLTWLSMSAAWADTGAVGEWTGWGIWTYGDSGINCNMKIQFEETSVRFSRLGGVFDCNILALYSDPLSWSKSEGRLILNGQSAGEYSEGHVVTTEPVNEATRAVTTLDVQDDQASYMETWSQGDKVIYRIEGRLKRKKSSMKKPLGGFFHRAH